MKEREEIKEAAESKSETKKPTIAFCLPGNNFTDGFLISWTNVVRELVERQWPFYVSNFRAADMNNCRNKVTLGSASITPETVPFGGLEYDYMLWIDSDMVFNFEHIEKLLEDQKDIVGGVYAMNANGVTTAGFLKEDGNHRMTNKFIMNKIHPFEVDYNGFGFMLIKKGVFEKIKYPWFTHEEIGFSEIDITVATSEDVGWCSRAKKAGYKIWLDPTVKLGHDKRMRISLQ